MNLPVFRVDKCCPRCERQWIGNSFHPKEYWERRKFYPVSALCDDCLQDDEDKAVAREAAQRRERQKLADVGTVHDHRRPEPRHNYGVPYADG